MTKLDKVSTVKIVDTEKNTELVYLTETEPKKSTLGTSYFGTLNSKGLAKLQSLGHTINNETDYCSLIKEKLGLADDEVGDRGSKWDTVEARQRYKVFIDNVPFEPEFTAKQKAQIEKMEIAVPKVPQTNAEPLELPKAIIPPAPVPADTQELVLPKAIVIPQAETEPTAEDLSYVEKVKEYRASGQWTEEQLLTSLAGEVGVGLERANVILSLSN